MSITLKVKLEALLNQMVEVTTIGGESGSKGKLLEVGADYLVMNPDDAWDDKLVRIVPFSAIDSIDVSVPKQDS